MPIPEIHLVKEIVHLESSLTVAIDDAKCKVSEDCITIKDNTITINASIDGVNYQCGREIDSISIRMVFEEGKIARAFIFRSKVTCQKFIFGDETGPEAKHIRSLLESSGISSKHESIMLLVTDAVSLVISSLFMAKREMNATANEMIALRKKFFITGWRRRISAARVHTMLRKAIDGEIVNDIDEEMIARPEILRKIKSTSCSSSEDELDDMNDIDPFFIINGQLAFRETTTNNVEFLFNYSMTECLFIECQLKDKKLESVNLKIRNSKKCVCIPVDDSSVLDPLIELLLFNNLLSPNFACDRLMIEKMLLMLVRTAFNKVISARREKIVMIDFTVNSTKIISDVKRTGWSNEITRYNTSQKPQDMFNIDDCVFRWKSS